MKYISYPIIFQIHNINKHVTKLNVLTIPYNLNKSTYFGRYF